MPGFPVQVSHRGRGAQIIEQLTAPWRPGKARNFAFGIVQVSEHESVGRTGLDTCSLKGSILDRLVVGLRIDLGSE